MPSPSDTVRLSTMRTSRSVDGAGGELGALHRRRQGAGDRDDEDAGGAPFGEAAVRLLEPARATGAAVDGSSGEAAQRAQNSAVVSSSRSVSSSSPKRMLSGTTSMPHFSTRSSGRSQELSVTMPIASSWLGDCWLGRGAGTLSAAGASGRRAVAARPRPRRATRRWPTWTGCRPRRAAPGARRRRRRKWPYHHDRSTSRAPPVTTWPRPDRAFTRAVRTSGSWARLRAAGVSNSIPIAEVPLAARLHVDR